MLKNILSITGRPGLYKLISKGLSMLVVESLVDKKRLPVHARDKVVSLGDISMFTDDEDIELAQVLENLKNLQNGAKVDIDLKKATPAQLSEFFAQVLPNYDRDRVHISDIKKLISWYNILIESGNDTFIEPEQEAQTEE